MVRTINKYYMYPRYAAVFIDRFNKGYVYRCIGKRAANRSEVYRVIEYVGDCPADV